ncbi:hypothetical protein [Corynebacterium sp. A21]|uniref:hypothetical protein n=1 Tax=Corynebacterium sp. A21 TaxID=3457318 RepID=UPI003FD06822
MRQSRTITVELPKVEDVAFIEGKYGTLISRHPSGNVWLDSDYVQFNILPEELEPIARTLLAMHYRKAQQ